MTNSEPRLDRKLPRAVQILILVVAGLIPTFYVLKHYDQQTQFTSLIYFGDKMRPRELAEVRELKPAANFPMGYDGQYYAQFALKPLLNDPQFLRTFDAPYHRGSRIFLPALAYVLGLGKPFWILQVYALLNLAFWFLLLFGMVHHLRAQTARDYLCIMAAVFTTGSLISVQRALTDLPAATLGFYAAALGGILGACAISAAVETKDTSLLFVLQYAWPLPKNRAAILVLARYAAIIIIPLVLWRIYLQHVIGKGFSDIGAFGLPFKGWVEYVGATWKALLDTKFDASNYMTLLEMWHHPWNATGNVVFQVNFWQWKLLEFLAPVSVMAQALYFAIWRQPQNVYWRMGVGFAVMYIFFTPHVFEEQIGFCRSVLPLTIAFNICLMRQKGGTFAFNFLAGNLGLVWAFRDTVYYGIFQ